MNTTLILKRAAARRATASRTDASWQLTDEQWFLIADLLEPPPPSSAGGRPWTNSRACLEGILWVLRTGARWKDLPKSFPSPSSCWRRLKLWTENGLFTKAWERALRKLDSLQGVDWEQAMADATFSPAKGGDGVGPTKKGKGTKIMVLVDGDGVPLAVDVANGSTAEVKLIESLLEQRVHPRIPRRLIYDRAADCDGLRQRLARRGIELISPHRRGRKRPVTQDGRALRRYRHRWKIERTISWLQNYRRLVTRYEVHVHLFLGFAQLAALLTTFKRL